MNAIDELLAEGRLARVPPDQPRAAAIAAEAKLHLESAAAIAKANPNGAYHLLYDAARRSVTAHMLAGGYRPTGATGAHAAVAIYATELLKTPSAGQLDRMRRARNRSEYDVAHFSARVVEADLAHAQAIVDAVATALAKRTD